MAEHSSIEWTDATWNPITGCSVVSPGCTNCYAMRLAGTRLKHHPSRAGLTQATKAGPIWTGEVRLNPDWLDQPLSWRRPRRIFVCAHGDLFHEAVPDEWIDKVFAVMAMADHHVLQVLTKRASRMRQYLTDPETWSRIAYHIAAMGGCVRASMGLPLPNVWLGVSAEDQPRADERTPELLATPAAVRFLSYEPALGPLDLVSPLYTGEGGITMRGYLRDPSEADDFHHWARKLDWVIAGGENGDRPMHPDWARQVRDACAAAGVPFFFKQWGSWSVTYDRDRDDPDWRRCPTARHNRERYLNLAGGHGFHGERVVFVKHLGKAAAGRELDGRTHDALPEVRSDG